MGNFESEVIEELAGKICRAARLKRFRFEFYMDSEMKPLSSKENQDVDEVPMLLEGLKREYGLTYEVKDTQKMSLKEIKRAYDSSAHWASSPKRPFGISYMIYEIFVGGAAGDLFGKEIPAMIVSDFSGDIEFVLPCHCRKERFSLAQKVDGEKPEFHEEATITICKFLTACERGLKLARGEEV